MDISICISCLSDEDLAQRLLEKSEPGECEICHKQDNVADFDELVEIVHETMEIFYSQTSSDPTGYDYYLAREDRWEQGGDPISDLLGSLVIDNETAVEMIREALENNYGVTPEDSLSMCDCPYDTESQYEERMLNPMPLIGQWRKLKNILAERSRYINKDAIKLLDDVFSELEHLKTPSGIPVIKKYSPSNNEIKFYRARFVHDDDELEELIKGLPFSLAAAPSHLASSGRMNASGVSVFYGALDIDTCVAEIRPPVSSIVAVGEFEPVSDIQLLDLDELLKLVPLGSFFDKDYQLKIVHTQFLKHLVQEIGRPVIAGANKNDYLATQFISEYLAQYESVDIDGILFNSTQRDLDSSNVVLFNKSSRTMVDRVMQSSEFTINMGYSTDEEWDDEISIWRTPDINKTKDEIEEIDLIAFGFPNTNKDDRPAILKCNVENTKIFRLDGICYKTSPRDIRFHDRKLESGIEEPGF